MTKATPYASLSPNDEIMCDPDFTPNDLKAKKTPNCRIPAKVKTVWPKRVHVQILDERRNGKRLWYNTDTYGGLFVVLREAIEKNDKEFDRLVNH